MIDSKQPYILLVLMAAGGILSDPKEHDEGASPQELMKNSSHRGAKPLSLASEQVAYIFRRGESYPIRIGMGSNSQGAGAPRWTGPLR